MTKRPKSIDQFYHEYLDEVINWRPNEPVPKESITRILNRYDTLSDDDRETLLLILLSDIRHCYKHPRIVKEELEIDVCYKRRVADFKIWVMKFMSISIIVGLMSIFTIIILTHSYTLGFNPEMVAESIKSSFLTLIGLR